MKKSLWGIAIVGAVWAYLLTKHPYVGTATVLGLFFVQYLYFRFVTLRRA